MALLGLLIKNFINLKYEFNKSIIPPEKLQEQQLRWLLREAQYTKFGKHYDFEKLLTSKEVVTNYQKTVPIFEYDEMHSKWWNRQQTTENITWKGKTDYFALSSGTTSESKRIPVTKDMLNCIQSVGKKQIESLANFDLPSKFFEKEILMLGSSTMLEKRNGHLEGEITGISAGNLPQWMQRKYQPGIDIAKIADWDIKAQRIAEEAPKWDIAAISGIPFWMIRMLKKVIATHKLETIHDLWPNLSIYVSGGVNFEPYRAEFSQLTARPLTIMDTYLASEGFLAYNARPNTMSMRLATNNRIFFEFVPFDERGFDKEGNILKKPIVFTYSDLEEGKDYALLISTPAGAWRYLIGDTIKFTSLQKNEIILSGRTKYFLNVIGAQLTEEKMDAAIQQLSEEMNVSIKEYSVAALPDAQGIYYHQWVLCTSDHLDDNLAARRLDEILRENKNYNSSRSKVLEYVTLQSVPSERLHNWLRKENPNGGQLKVPKVIDADRMNDLIAFLGK